MFRSFLALFHAQDHSLCCSLSRHYVVNGSVLSMALCHLRHYVIWLHMSISGCGPEEFSFMALCCEWHYATWGTMLSGCTCPRMAVATCSSEPLVFAFGLDGTILWMAPCLSWHYAIRGTMSFSGPFSLLLSPKALCCGWLLALPEHPVFQEHFVMDD